MVWNPDNGGNFHPAEARGERDPHSRHRDCPERPRKMSIEQGRARVFLLKKQHDVNCRVFET